MRPHRLSALRANTGGRIVGHGTARQRSHRIRLVHTAQLALADRRRGLGSAQSHSPPR
jgi:hypothetical protein